MTPDQTAGEIKRAVNELGGAFIECPKTLRRARQLGLAGWAFYIAGRAGALGDVSPDTAAAALGFVAPDAVRDGWEAGRRVVPPPRIAEYHRAECCRWGRENLSSFPRAQRLVDLAEKVVVGAETAGMPLFAAWRAVPVPDGGLGARAAVLVDLLREHRCGAHLIAVRVAGLSPLEAIVAGPDGPAGAAAYGWPEPFPTIQPLIRRRAWAEALTDRLAGDAYRTLTVDERIDLAQVLDEALGYVRAHAAAPSLL